MWNYNYVVPDFIVLLVFFFFYLSKKRVPIRVNKSFLNILVLELIVLVADVLASLSIEHGASSSFAVVKILNILFFVFFILRSLCFFMCTCDLMQVRIECIRPLQVISFFVFALSEFFVLLNVFFPTVFELSDSIIYSRASTYNVIYVSCFYFIMVSLVIIFYKSKKVSRVNFYTALVFNLIVFAGYVMRIIFSNFLIMDLFCLVAIIIIYLSYENPDFYLEEKSGTFNTSSLNDLLRELKVTKNSFAVGFAIHNYNELREIYGGSQMDNAISQIGDFLTKKYQNLLTFYVRSGRFIIINVSSSIAADDFCSQVSRRFLDGWSADDDTDVYLEIDFARLSPEVSFSEPEKAVNGLITALSSMDKVSGASVYVTEETIKSIEGKKEVKRAVERAVENDAVELFLQPLVDVNTHKLVGAEALARIRNSKGELIPPAEFIPIAERNGRINILGEQMFEKACRFIRDNDMQAMGLSWINVNLSPIQFFRMDLNERFTSILKKFKIPARMVHLEITEESMIDYALLLKQILAMKKSGFQFVLDDYGSGYSNVTRLKRCPFVNVKLDMELVWDYFREQDKILPTLVQTFKQMNFTVTAEGIENEDMAEAMKKIGCDYLQGFYFAKPLPADEFLIKYSANQGA
ncbi:EAL domain-containing protein [Treponema rectale]|uniref:EAL domain-containing protein n=1 Tax=Treponema rectale TaxID=744512 RepID=A0A840S864_9SPIR|nr:EAL domain-containing protein (putative c-di-GMP-specific phosphodiesterase class I) [Treponema rectale]QOS40428.1 EAL domain-containing protein [Treponema rectale]